MPASSKPIATASPRSAISRSAEVDRALGEARACSRTASTASPGDWRATTGPRSGRRLDRLGPQREGLFGLRRAGRGRRRAQSGPAERARLVPDEPRPDPGIRCAPSTPRCESPAARRATRPITASRSRCSRPAKRSRRAAPPPQAQSHDRAAQRRRRASARTARLGAPTTRVATPRRCNGSIAARPSRPTRAI